MAEKINAEDLNAVRLFLRVFHTVENWEEILQKVLTANEEMTQITTEGNKARKERDQIRIEIQKLKRDQEGLVQSLEEEKKARIKGIESTLADLRTNVTLTIDRELVEGRERIQNALADSVEELARLDQGILAKSKEESELTALIEKGKTDAEHLEDRITKLAAFKKQHEMDIETALALLQGGK